MKKKSVFILFYSLSVNILFAQYTDFNHVNFYPPQSASLMRYIDYPIGYSTGIPDINIPLYTISSNKLSFALKLSFHIDNYLRINQLPGVAGAGWTLNNKISITRAIRGVDDFFRKKNGYYTNKNIPVNYSGEYIIKDSNYLRKLYQNELDEEPDKFYYQLLDRSGSFFFQRQPDGSMKAIPVPNDGTKISYNDNTGQFLIVDTNGTKYEFSTSHYDWSQPNYGPYTIMAWNCEKIYNAFGEEEFSFNYSNNTIYTDIFDFNPRIEVYDDYHETSAFYHLLCATDGQPLNTSFWNASGPKMISYSGREVKGEILYEPTYSQGGGRPYFKNYEHIGISPPSGVIRKVSENLLTSLSFKGGVIEFIYEKKHILTEINIKSVIGESLFSISTIKLTHSDHSGTEMRINEVSFMNNDAYKRTLNKLEIDDQQYQFSYGSTHEGNVPTDFWGYRSKDPFYIDVPLMDTKIDLAIDIENSYPHHNLVFETCAKSYYKIVNNFKIPHDDYDIWQQYPEIKGLLKIKYPTGGSVEFDVEGNQFVNDNNQVKGCGGYRIKAIKYINADNSLVKVKKYSYGENESGGGKIKVIPSSDAMIGNTFTEQSIGYYYGDGANYPLQQERTARKRTFYPNTTFSANFDNSSNVIYGQVAEYDSSNNSLTGKTVYYSNDTQGYPTGFPQYPYAIENEQSWSLGKLDSVLYYKWDENKPGPVNLVKRKTYKYENYYDPIQIFQGRVWLKKIPELLPGATLGSPYLTYDEFFEGEADFLYHQNSIRTGYHKLTKEEESLIVNGMVSHTIEKTYFYRQPQDVYPCKTETKLSDSSILNNHFVYATDFIAPNYNEGLFIDRMLDKNMIAIPIENVTRRNGKIVSATLYRYNLDGTLASQMGLKQFPPTENEFKLSNKNKGVYSHESGITTFNRDEVYEKEFSILLYDMYKNPVCIKDEKNGLLTFYLWSHKGKYLVAEIQNATYEQVKMALGGKSPESMSQEVSQSTINELTDGLRAIFLDSQVTIATYTYEPLIGIKSKTNPNGATTIYEYDTFGRLQYIKDENEKIIQEYNYHYQR